jgi:hypothetical protein
LEARTAAEIKTAFATIVQEKVGAIAPRLALFSSSDGMDA